MEGVPGRILIKILIQFWNELLEGSQKNFPQEIPREIQVAILEEFLEKVLKNSERNFWKHYGSSSWNDFLDKS